MEAEQLKAEELEMEMLLEDLVKKEAKEQRFEDHPESKESWLRMEKNRLVINRIHDTRQVYAPKENK